MQVTCQKCGRAFRASPAWKQRYCSRACWREATGRKPQSCECCGEPFVAKELGQKYCSSSCYVRTRWGEPTPHPPCELCGEDVTPTRDHQRFCSRECYYRSEIGRVRPDSLTLGGRGHERVQHPKITINTLSATDAAYLAGLVDGEGCITHASGGQRNAVVNVSNTRLRLLLWCQDVVGAGGISRHRRKPPWKECGAWRLGGANATDLLQQLLPYLVIKRDQAELAIDFALQQREHAMNDNEWKSEYIAKMSALKAQSDWPPVKEGAEREAHAS